MAKKKIALRNLGKQHIKDQLIRSFPFLRNKYRELTESDLNNEDTFKELFGDEPYQAHYLRAVYEYQR